MTKPKKRNRPYRKPTKYDPVIQGEKLEQLFHKTQQLADTTNSVIQNYDRHIEYLANFVKHDIKNGIHSIDGLIYNSNIPEKEKDALKTAIEVLRTSLDNFSKITQGGNNEPFIARDLFNALTMLVRNDLINKNITLNIDCDKEDETPIHQSLQAFLQILHNLIINAINALTSVSNEKSIKIHFSHDSEHGKLEVYDSGTAIADHSKIWDYRYSTTGGTGIGLFHIDYLVKAMNGERECIILGSDLYTKKFVVTFPLNSHCDENE